MSPGRELDILIAERVMGLQKLHDGFEMSNWEPVFEDGFRASDYSTDIASAWEVVEKLKRSHHYLSIAWEHDRWLCYLNRERDERVEADTAPHAICLAALNITADK